MNIVEIERQIIANKGNSTQINSIVSSIESRMKEIDYIMEKFLDEYPESDDPKIIKFEVSHNYEYSTLTRLMRIANAYS